MLYWIHYIKLIGVSDMICYKIEESFEECKSCEGYTGDTVVVVSDKELKNLFTDRAYQYSIAFPVLLILPWTFLFREKIFLSI